MIDIAATILHLAKIKHPVENGTAAGEFRGRQIVPLKNKSWRGLFERGEKCHDESEQLG